MSGDHGHSHAPAPRTGQDITVDVDPAGVIKRYKQLVSRLQEENLALDTALENAVGQIAELNAKVTALTPEDDEPVGLQVDEPRPDSSLIDTATDEKAAKDPKPGPPPTSAANA